MNTLKIKIKNYLKQLNDCRDACITALGSNSTLGTWVFITGWNIVTTLCISLDMASMSSVTVALVLFALGLFLTETATLNKNISIEPIGILIILNECYVAVANFVAVFKQLPI
jgi:hypothetical protein